MILLTAGYLTDGHEKLYKVGQLLVAVLFAVLSGGWWGFIAIAVVVGFKIHTICLTAGLLYTIYSFIKMAESGTVDGYHIAKMVLGLIVVEVLIILIVFIRMLIKRKEEMRIEEARRMMGYGLSEMHEIKKNKELSQQSFYIEKNARLLERENISRNIHNSVGHSITAAIMTLDAADMLFDKNPEEAHKRMNDAAVRIRGSLESIRSAVRALDTEDEDISVKDMMCYTDNIVDEFIMDTEITCDRIYDMYSEDMTLPKEHAEFLTGALSEFLTNGVKHGGATSFMVKLSGDSGHIRLEVKDNGSSDFSEDTKDELIHKGFGLKKLRSYASRYGGITEFRNDEGFFSMIELPLGE
ncbi:MAG: hypothetical protein J6Z74_04645 [Eubacterium sp.]|nr:hypothetical protein [Eubacterium sp.]